MAPTHAETGNLGHPVSPTYARADMAVRSISHRRRRNRMKSNAKFIHEQNIWVMIIVVVSLVVDTVKDGVKDRLGCTN
jgi:hypothetical protein